MFLGNPESARCAVPSLIPVSATISPQGRPCARRLAIPATPTTTRGLPRGACPRGPALTRSAGSASLVLRLRHPVYSLQRCGIKMGGSCVWDAARFPASIRQLGGRMPTIARGSWSWNDFIETMKAIYQSPESPGESFDLNQTYDTLLGGRIGV